MRDSVITLKNISSLVIVVAAIVFIAARYKKETLPPPEEISSSLLQEPIQRFVREESFSLDYRGSTYTVEPVADYEISGMVVTHNDIEAFSDIYHDENSVDIKDLCLLWGENLEYGVYKKDIKFWSEPWTCFFYADSRDTFNEFNKDQISNSHLLSEHESVREKIRSVRIGDQVKLKGQLVNYFPEGRDYMRRKTSTTRTDTGNGACEVMLVDSINVIKRGAPEWNRAYDISKIIILLALGLKLLMFLTVPYRHYN